MHKYRFTDSDGSFALDGAENDMGLYFPIAGEQGIKSSVTPNLLGDIKLDQNHFVMEPVSIENLHNNRSGRNFWCCVKGVGAWSATGASAEQQAARYTEHQEPSGVEAGLMWHKAWRRSQVYGLDASVTSFVPLQHNTEIMQVKLRNTGKHPVTFIPIAAVPIYGRSADNIRDHRHVTSLLHRITVSEHGVRVTPTLSFDERGHQLNDTTYFVEGMTGQGEAPVEFFPEVSSFIGTAGNLERPEAVLRNMPGVCSGETLAGQEAMGGLKFPECTLSPQEEACYIIFIGASRQTWEIDQLYRSFSCGDDVEREFYRTKQYWNNKVNVKYHSSDEQFDRFMHWVSFQPELRRIYGCSFLPHHDYGKGGRGWRDLWQDCLALLMMNPGGVRQMLLGNFAGVRIDGSNATIIGECPGEFKADRNSITRVWMDHGVWPFMTTKLYIDQTGDNSILYQNAAYFKDAQVMRGRDRDEQWEPGEQWQLDERGSQYQGTVLEHLLLQNLTAFWEVGEHNHILLRDADWNDAIDMAGQRGESVAFSNAYAQNLLDLAELLERDNSRQLELLQEIEMLLTDDMALYEDWKEKRKLLQNYLKTVCHRVSGIRIRIDAGRVAASLRHKAEWMMEHIRQQEWVEDSAQNGWFNGYYDNQGRRVEGIVSGENGEEQVRMMLTSQVFAIMAGTATDDQIVSIVRSADKYLYDAACGGYRLNTDFRELKTDMGRMFGFAYGEKENGAVFSHMAVMYANALYRRGYAEEGFRALNSLYEQAMDFSRSRIYPGIPEYFGRDGRGLYHYLTGAASWYMLTVITQMFGVRGDGGGLVIAPKLLRRQFDKDHMAALELRFADIPWRIEISNVLDKEYGSYRVERVLVDEKELGSCSDSEWRLTREGLQELDSQRQHKIRVILK